MKKKVTYHLPLTKHQELEAGMWFECAKEIDMSLRLRNMTQESEKIIHKVVKVQKGFRVQIKDIIQSIPRAIVFDTDIIDEYGEIKTLEVAYPLALFQEYFKQVLIGKNTKLLGYTRKS